MTPITTAAVLLRAGRTDDELYDLLRLQRERMQNYMKLKAKNINRETLSEVSTYLRESFDIHLNEDQLEQFFDLFPEARIEIIENGVDDTEATGILMESLAVFLTGCSFLDSFDFKYWMREQIDLMFPTKKD